MVTAAIWPALDGSRVPYRLHYYAEIYAREQERISRGPVWSYLGIVGHFAEVCRPFGTAVEIVGETALIAAR
jgi:anthranilate 1,2-dioxygenase large subunit